MKQSAGILMFRFNHDELEVLLVHPGGPFWARKDLGAWTVPKGELDDGEAPLDAARREFREETGATVDGELIELAPVRQKAGKVVHAWAVEGNLDAADISSNLVRSKAGPFPEIDRAEWFSLEEAARKINPAQVSFLDELRRKLAR